MGCEYLKNLNATSLLFDVFNTFFFLNWCGE